MEISRCFIFEMAINIALRKKVNCNYDKRSQKSYTCIFFPTSCMPVSTKKKKNCEQLGTRPSFSFLIHNFILQHYKKEFISFASCSKQVNRGFKLFDKLPAWTGCHSTYWPVLCKENSSDQTTHSCFRKNYKYHVNIANIFTFEKQLLPNNLILQKPLNKSTPITEKLHYAFAR